MQRCRGLGSVVLLLLLGQSLALLIEIPQDVVSGTVGQSVLLPVSYRVNSSLRFPVSIRWKFGNSRQVIITTCSVQNCSLDAWGAPSKCSALYFPHAKYRDRVEVFPENASLLLWDLRLSDSGLYSVTFTQQNQSRRITLAVHKEPVSSEHLDEEPDNKHQDNIHYYIIGVCSLVGLLLLFLVLCIRRWVWQKKMGTTTQQQASDTEDIYNTMAGDVVTIYARIGEDMEETKPRALPDTLYASVTFPHLPSALAPNLAGDRAAAEPRLTVEHDFKIFFQGVVEGVTW
ncbi:hypothetical protein ASZ78_016875 [Callipepla squamata]|uniref:Uncharacterized protein n=1 Tax=Callipepla squamata TaxID=9009 RepID=A0A226MTQ9_CALSU|nr:hypothetical protein ASZ78_016875 [Callipepla squamata]